jgi:CubicO group peptidase (beta-lactamase class C family)
MSWDILNRLIATIAAAVLLTATAAAQPPIVHGPLAQTLDAHMARLEAYGFSGSLLVAKGGEVILQKGYGFADADRKAPFTADTAFDIGSITKQFTAAAVMKLEMQGKLSVQDPVSRWFDGVPEDKKAITIHHLLTHSAGLEDVFGDDYEEMPRDELVKKALASKLLWPPGTRYRYSNAGYSLLGAIVEKASGQPYEVFLKESLWKPAGMTRTGYLLQEKGPLARGVQDGKDWGTPLDHAWASDGPWWNLRANGGVISTVGDLYKWHQALEGEAILSKEAKAKIFTPHVAEDEEGRSHYGYGWAIFKTPRGTRLQDPARHPADRPQRRQRHLQRRLPALRGRGRRDPRRFQPIGHALHPGHGARHVPDLRRRLRSAAGRGAGGSGRDPEARRQLCAPLRRPADAGRGREPLRLAGCAGHSGREGCAPASGRGCEGPGKRRARGAPAVSPGGEPEGRIRSAL